MQFLTLTTDFGIRDWFVGTMKGVVLGINPRVTLVDITHEIPAGDIRAGAFALAASFRFFPRGTTHVAVVDPGVGSARNAIAVQTAEHLFVGPDNGVLSFALAREKIKAVRRLENERYFLLPASRTFHGRDVFAPVAAHLSRGVPIRKLGSAQEDFVRLPWPEPRMHGSRIEGEVLYLDRFGNAITNIENSSLGVLHRCRVFSGNKLLGPVGTFYRSVRPGQALGVPGSTGLLEISVNGGSAAKALNLRAGDPVEVRWSRD